MNYEQTLQYLYSRLPMFSKIGAAAIKKDLKNTLELCRRIGNPETRFKTIHVGGTNGKGSVSHMLAAILQDAGYKTGLYTSPHLKDFRERIRINGKMISQEFVTEFTAQQLKTIEEIEPSFFEVTVAMAFQYFEREKVDVAVIEVGLGGRLDSTNVINPLLSIITNIGYDHTNILGNTLQEIATEKAGIIKPGVPVIIGERCPETESVFLTKSRETSSRIVFASDEWAVNIEPDGTDSPGFFLKVQAGQASGERNLNLELDLKGTYQVKNLKTILSAVAVLRNQGFVIDDAALVSALKNVTELTGLMGRWQTLSTMPLIICDTGHNEHGIKEVVKNIESTPHHQLHMVFGMVKDKDALKVLALLPKTARYYFCQPAIERAKPAQELADEARNFYLKGEVFTSVPEALAYAKKAAAKEDLIFVGGSTFVVAEII